MTDTETPSSVTDSNGFEIRFGGPSPNNRQALPIDSARLLAQVTAAKAYSISAWLPGAFTKFGPATAKLWAFYIAGNADLIPSLQVYTDGSELVEACIVARGLRESTTYKSFVAELRNFALRAIQSLFDDKTLSCDEFDEREVIAMDFTQLNGAKQQVDPHGEGGGVDIILRFDNILEIPGNLAGGGGGGPTPELNPHGGTEGQVYKDTRRFSGTVLLTRHSPGVVNVNFLVDFTVQDTVDFSPGNPGTIEKIFTTALKRLFHNLSRASLVSFGRTLRLRKPTYLITIRLVPHPRFHPKSTARRRAIGYETAFKLLKLTDNSYDVPFRAKFRDRDNFKPAELKVGNVDPDDEDCDDPERPAIASRSRRWRSRRRSSSTPRRSS